jgi:hypothetical protein
MNDRTNPSNNTEERERQRRIKPEDEKGYGEGLSTHV